MRSAMLCAALLSNIASAESIKFCIKHTGLYSDDNVGEDYWTDDLPKLARGAWARVDKGSTNYFDGYLGDGIGSGDPGTGCTSTLSVPTANGTYDIQVGSFGSASVQGNTIKARDRVDGSTYIYGEFVSITDGPGTKYVSLTIPAGAVWDVYNVYNAGAYAIWRHAGGMTGKLYDFWVGPLQSGDPCGVNCYDGTNIYISNVGKGRKFVIVHEQGHRLAHLKIGDPPMFRSAAGQPYYCDMFNDAGWNATIGCCDSPTDPNDNPDPNCPTEGTDTSPDTHQMNGKENTGCANVEGHAHFYSADVWNVDTGTDPDCKFKYYKTITEQGTSYTNPTVNCEAGTPSFLPTAYMEAQCGSSSTWPGKGTELDWMRMWWDFHTSGAGETPPTFTQIVAMMDYATPWDDDSCYQNLDAAAQTYNGGAFDSQWNYDTSLNGVDH